MGETVCEIEEMCVAQEDVQHLHACLEADNPPLQRACLFPRYEQLALFAEQHPGAGFADALEAFAEQCATLPMLRMQTPAAERAPAIMHAVLYCDTQSRLWADNRGHNLLLVQANMH